MSKYNLKSGQINFESKENIGAFACVVIKNGKFHNLTSDLRMQLVKLLQQHDCDKPIEQTLEDMF